MKKILFLVSQLGDKSRSLVQNLNKELNNSKIYLAQFSEVSFQINKAEVIVKVASKKLTNFDMVYFRKAKGGGKNYVSLAATIAHFLDKKGIAYFDSIYGHVAIGDKLMASVRLALAGLPIIPTYYYSASAAKLAFASLSRSLGLPFIVKHPYLQRLKSVYIVKSEEDFRKILKLKFEGYIFQKFIDIREEYRVLVLGDGVGVVHTKVKRSYKDLKIDYLDMVTYGHYVDVEAFPEKLKTVSVRAAKVLNLEIAGVDLAVGSAGNSWLVEVNRGPGLYEHKDDHPAVLALAKFLTKQLR